MSLGSIIVRLTMDTATFDTDAGRAAKIAQKRANEIDASFRKAGKAIGAALGLSLAGVVTGLTVATKAAIDNADAMRDLSIRTGVSTETLSAYGYAATQTGTDIDTVAKGIKILSKNMADALNPTNTNAKVFKALGIDVLDATKHLKTADAIIPELADKISGMADGTEKAALMLQLFGKAGLEMTEFMNQGASGLDAFAEKARALGIIISQETADAADKFNDDLADLKAAAGGLALQLAEALLPAMDDLVVSFKDFVAEGEGAKDMAHGVADGFHEMVEAGELVGGLIDIFQGLRTVLNGLQDQANAVTDSIKATLSGNLTGIQDAMRRYREASAEVDAGFRGEKYDRTRGSSFQNVIGGSRGNVFENVRSHVDSQSAGGINSKALQDALSGAKVASGSKARKAALSDEDKAAKDLAEDYKRLTASMQERIGLFGAETEVAKVTYDTQAGSLKALGQAEKDTLLAQAKELDALKEKQDLMAEGKSLIESILTPTEQVNKQIAEAGKLLAAGAIAQADYNKAVAGYRTPAQDVIDGLQEEIRLLGMTNEQQDLYNALKYAGADATKAQIEQITGLIHAREQAAKAADLQREVESQLSDAIFDFATGAKSAKEAAVDFFDSIAEYITRMIAENWAKQIAGMFNTSGQEGDGTNWFSMLAGLFGGARAYGGTTNANTAYWVGERGPELFVPQSSGTVIPADNSARMARSGGGGGVTNIFHVNGSVSDRTAVQMRQEQQLLQRRDTARNY